MRLNLIRNTVLSALCVGALMGAPALAQEVIRAYHSEINVKADASVTVQETIRVNCQGVEIKHGIYRDFPTRYEDQYGNHYVVGFEVLAVTRDGAPEPYHFGRMSNGERLYIGDPNVFVSTGEHTYTIQYKTNRQLGFFGDRNEFYWNVTGNGWNFPIERASAGVTLPAGISMSDVKVLGWTGPQGSTAKYLRFVYYPDRVVCETTSTLYPREGLTIAVSWPKGHIAVPTTAMKIRWLLSDNVSLLVLLLGLMTVIAYFVWAQTKVGIDPARGAIVPQWEPPDGLSPAAVRYISRMGSDNKTLSAALIDAGVKGSILIDESDGEYTIKRAGTGSAPLTPEESAVTHGLLGSGDAIVMKQSNNEKIRAAVEQFKGSLGSQFGKSFFATHIGYAVFGTVLSLATLAIAFLVDPRVTVAMVVAAILFISVNVLFGRLLRAYTRKGRALMDKAEGMRMYMEAAEKERLDAMNPPDKTPQLFEKLLPYAIALGVEQRWSEQFADVLAKAQAEGYQPSWYVGPSFVSMDSSGFTSSIADSTSAFSDSFAGAISSSSTPPGSSSGGGGGGSSGGGGGGGGGGGW
jgi:uncharacterized membrane protein YgcG